MHLRFVTTTVGAKGQRDTSVEEHDCDSITLGRGSTSKILLPSRLVSLCHARIREDAGKLVIEDLQSDAGTRVNGSPVNRQALRNGDKLKLGDIEINVALQEGSDALELNWERHLADEVDDEKLTAKRLSALDLTRALPSQTLLSSALIAIVVVLFLVGPFSGYNTESWNSGTISTPHSLIADDCTSCHTTGFVQVQDDACLSCHAMTEHAEKLEQLTKFHSAKDFRCAQCHMEHNGDHGLIASDSSLCTQCHANLKTDLPLSTRLDVPNFDQHPQFRIAVETSRAKLEDGPELIAIDAEEAEDQTAIKLNHKLHLEPDIEGPDGPTTLACVDCHVPTDNGTTMAPISFEAHCADCHTLGFDDELPDSSVPHGNPDTVYNFIYAEYAKLHLADAQANIPRPKRFAPGRKVAGPVVEKQFLREAVVEMARVAEEELFSKRACFLCHEVAHAVGAKAHELDQLQKSKYKVVEPMIPEHWYVASIFSHAAHQEVKCESCHAGVVDSEETSDLLLPGVQDCKACHADGAGLGTVQSDCIMCHSYHAPDELSADRKRTIEELLVSFNE